MLARPTASLKNVDDASFDSVAGNGDERNGHGKIETAGAGATGIEVEDSFARFLPGLVGVAGDDSGNPDSGGADVEIGEGVDEIEETA